MNPAHTMTASTGVSRAARDGEGAGSSSASSVWTFAFAPFAAAFFAGFFLERGMGRAASLG